MKYYAIAKGLVPGIYTNWPDAQKQVKGFSGATYKSFPTKELALEYMKRYDVILDCPQSGESKVKKESSCSPKEQPKGIVIYTDGSYKNKKAGFSAIILDKDTKIIAYGSVPKEVGCTNNVAELYAIYVAVSLIQEEDVTIFTDSRYCMLCLEGYDKKWGSEKPNVKLIHAIAKLMVGRKVKFQHVSAHVGIELNEEADRLAEAGRIQDELLIVKRIS